MRNNIKSKVLLLIMGVVFVSSCQNESVEPVGNITKTYGDSIAARAAVNLPGSGKTGRYRTASYTA